MSTPSPNTSLLSGPLLLGNLFNWLLLGFEFSQFLHYNPYLKRDGLWTRRLVFFVISIDVIQTLLTTTHAWSTIGGGWGDTVALGTSVSPLTVVPFFTGLVACLVQLFNAQRVRHLSVSKWIVLVICLFAGLQLLGSILYGIHFVLLDGELPRLHNKLTPFSSLWLGSSALCDLMIMCTLVTFLMINMTGFAQTDDVLHHLIHTSLVNGLSTTVLCGTTSLFVLVFKHNYLYLMFMLPLGKVYSLTLLTTLSIRRHRLFTSPSPEPSRGNPHHQRKQSDHPLLDFTKVPLDRSTPFPAPEEDLDTQKAFTATTFTLSDDPQIRLHKGGFQTLVVPETPRMGSPRVIPVALEPLPTPPGFPMRPTKAQANADFDAHFPTMLVSQDRELDNTAQPMVDARRRFGDQTRI